MISINGVTLKTPSIYTVGIQDICEAERNSAGYLVKEIIATKRKITIGFNYLTGQEMKEILGLIENNFFTVTYFDPLENSNKTGEFYAGDRIVEFYSFINGVSIYKGFKVDIIER